jgi:hypothetical protein
MDGDRHPASSVSIQLDVLWSVERWDWLPVTQTIVSTPPDHCWMTSAGWRAAETSLIPPYTTPQWPLSSGWSVAEWLGGCRGGVVVVCAILFHALLGCSAGRSLIARLTLTKRRSAQPHPASGSRPTANLTSTPNCPSPTQRQTDDARQSMVQLSEDQACSPAERVADSPPTVPNLAIRQHHLVDEPRGTYFRILGLAGSIRSTT